MVGGIWKAEDAPDAGVLAMLKQGALDEAGSLEGWAALLDPDGLQIWLSTKCLGKLPGFHERNHDHAGGNSINRLRWLPKGRCAKSELCSWMCIDAVRGLRWLRSLNKAEYNAERSIHGAPLTLVILLPRRSIKGWRCVL